MGTYGPSPFLRRRRRKMLALSTGLVLVVAAVVFAVTDPPSTSAADGQTRTYYIAVDQVDWDYAPGSTNVPGEHLEEDPGTLLDGGDDRVGRVHRKSVYREYTDGTFRTLKTRPPEWEHLGLLGPPIHAAVGDTIKVVFKNNTPHPAGVHPDGLLDDEASERSDDVITEGGEHTYTWPVAKRAGPGPHDESSVLRAYRGHTDEIADTNAGLVGPLIVTRKSEARADGSPKDIDREVVALFNVYDENLSPWLDWNIEHHAGRAATVDEDNEDFVESNLKHSINGFLFGTMPGLDFRKGQKVRWYLMGAGTQTGLHTPHWHGNTVISEETWMDKLDVLPKTIKTADMVPHAPGEWLFHCHVNHHIVGGMSALYRVSP